MTTAPKQQRFRSGNTFWQRSFPLAAAAFSVLAVGGWQAVQAQEKPVFTPAQMEYLRALNLALEGSQPEALHLLAESLRHQPENNPAAAPIFELLTERRTNSGLQLHGHTGPVLYAAYSPDGRKIVTASSDHTARIWDANTGQQIGPALTSENDMVMAEFNPDGTLVVTASEDRTARVWDVATGQQVGEPLTDAHEMRFARFSPDGTLISTGAEEGTGRVWDARTHQPVMPPIHGHGDVFSIDFSPDSQRVVTANSDAKTDVLDAHTGKRLARIVLDNNIYTAVFSPDASKILTASGDHTARIWDASTGTAGGPVFRHGAWVLSALYNADATRVVTASGDHTARVWDAANGQAITPPLRHANIVNNARFSPDGRLVVTGSLDGTARLWDATTGEALSLPLPAGGPVACLALRPGGSTLLVASADRVVHCWDLPPMTTAPAWLADLAEFASTQVNYDVLRVPETHLITDLRTRMLASKSEEPWERFGRWYFLEPEDRPISPWSQVSLRQYVEVLAASKNPGVLDYGLTLTQKTPSLLNILSQARAEAGEPTQKPAPAKQDDD